MVDDAKESMSRFAAILHGCETSEANFYKLPAAVAPQIEDFFVNKENIKSMKNKNK